MNRGLIVIAALLFTACSEPLSEDLDAAIDARDASEDASSGDRDLDKDAEPECVCELVGPCCDGCEAVNVGEPCDDGLECTSAATCADDGVCRGAADACDHLVVEPQCQAVSCDDTAGCGAVENIREGFPCDDEDASTYDDRCSGGVCAGTPCECDAASECCDGCLAINDGGACDDGDPQTFGDACNGGICAGTCECDAGPCCDGCNFVAQGVVCAEGVDYKSGCTMEGQNRPWHRWYDQTCSGDSPLCDGPIVQGEGGVETCPPTTYCVEGECMI